MCENILFCAYALSMQKVTLETFFSKYVNNAEFHADLNSLKWCKRKDS